MPRASRTHARIRKTALLLLLGVMLNLLVAWGLALIPRYTDAANLRIMQVRAPNRAGGYDSFFYAAHQWFGVHEQQFYRTRRARTRPVPKRISVYWTWLPWDRSEQLLDAGNELFAGFAPEHPDNAVISNIRVGFPALTLEADTLVDDSAPLPNGDYPTQSHGGFFNRIDAARLAGKPSVWAHAQHLWFPYRPIWSGLAINTLFYTLLVVFVAWVLRHIKHARRMHLGRCPYCKYELHHDFSAGCPECGWRRETKPENNPA